MAAWNACARWLAHGGDADMSGWRAGVGPASVEGMSLTLDERGRDVKGQGTLQNVVGAQIRPLRIVSGAESPEGM